MANTASTTPAAECCETCTDAPRTDVNAQFDARRTAQITSLQEARAGLQSRVDEFESGAAQAALDAEIFRRVDAGEIKMVGPDRYMVLQGWDANEYFNVRKAQRPGELSLIEPEAGLDMVDGKAQGWFDQPEWHKLGIVDVGGLSDVDEVLAKSGLDYEVAKRPVRYYGEDGELHVLDRNYVTYRTDTSAGLGAVGETYRVIQNRRGFEVLQEIVGQRDAKFASAFPLDGGRRAVVSMELPEGIDIELPEGATEHVRLYLAYFNNHDGEGKMTCKVTPWRPRCRNTERLAVKDAVHSWGVRHTTNADQRIEQARKDLRMTLNYVDQFKAEEQALGAIAVTSDDIESLISSIWEPDETPTKRQATTAGRRSDQIHELWGVYGRDLGRNAYAAERAFTDWFDHVAPRRVVGSLKGAAAATAALTGADDKDKAKVHRQLLTLASR
jgi:phage/plasmid-like protein (TIGR03299 family)